MNLLCGCSECQQYQTVCSYLRGEVAWLEAELKLAYKRQAISNNPFPPILAEEVKQRIDELNDALVAPDVDQDADEDGARACRD